MDYETRNDDLIRLVHKLYDDIIPVEYVDHLVANVDVLDVALTSSSVNRDENYEVFEFLGDAVINHFICWYFVKLFPQLFRPEGVEYLARLKIKYASGEVFAQLSERYGIASLLLHAVAPHNLHKKYEDVFESFFGACVYVLDKKDTGIGFPLVSALLKSMYDTFDISLSRTNLFDAKTRLKELADSNKTILKSLQYASTTTETTLTIMTPDGRIDMPTIRSTKPKADREKEAAQSGLAYVRKRWNISDLDTPLFRRKRGGPETPKRPRNI